MYFWLNPTCSPKLLRNPQSLCAASVMSRPNLTAKKGRDCGHTDATSTLCFDTSHFWQGNNWSNVRFCSKCNNNATQCDNSLTFSGFRGHLVACCTLLSARTRSTSSRLCWEIFRLSSSDKQPSQDRQALSSSWDPSCTLGETEECVRWRVLYFKGVLHKRWMVKKGWWKSKQQRSKYLYF